jgi:hypothetical protein
MIGTILEKDSSNPPKIFSVWPKSIQENDDIVFAVKKEHDRKAKDSCFMPGEHEEDVLTFEDLALEALKNESNNFNYRGDEYSISSLQDGIGAISSKKGDVASVIYEAGEGIVEILEDKRKEVYKFSPTIPLQIEGGRLKNYKEYKESVDIEK